VFQPFQTFQSFKPFNRTEPRGLISILDLQSSILYHRILERLTISC